MAQSYFRFATPGVGLNPPINPLSYVQFSGAPTIPPVGGPNVAFIFATVQIISNTPRPTMSAALQTEINAAILSQTSSANAYVKP
jgi:hypothetical protein